MSKTSLLMTSIFTLPLAFGSLASAQTPTKKPNIVVIMADDVGIWNVSAGEKLWTMVPAVTIVGGFLEMFREYPPSQVGGSLSIEKALEMVQRGASGGGK